MHKRAFFITLVALIVFFIFSRIYVGGWILIRYWYLFLSIPIIHLFVHVKCLRKRATEWKISTRIILFSHIVFFIFTLLQVDYGDGPYYILVVELLSFLFTNLSKAVNQKVGINYWLVLQFVLGVATVITDIILLYKCRALQNKKN